VIAGWRAVRESKQEEAMNTLSGLMQSADWKKEKHVPVIDVPKKIKKGDACKLIVSVGKEYRTPTRRNTTFAGYRCIFCPRREISVSVRRVRFLRARRVGSGPEHEHRLRAAADRDDFNTEKSGTIFALAYCNIHGLWENSRDIEVK